MEMQTVAAFLRWAFFHLSSDLQCCGKWQDYIFVVVAQLSVRTHKLHFTYPFIGWTLRLLPFLDDCTSCCSEHKMWVFVTCWFHFQHVQ